MQEYWELYMKPIEGKAASVLFNAGIAEQISETALGYVGFVRVPMREPNERGLISEAEEAQLSFIEDRLEMEALRYRIGTYVGKIASAGEVTFFYYLKHEFEWPDVVGAAMGHFEGYAYTFGSGTDGGWDVYRRLLLPTPAEWQMIRNHKVCDRLRESGDSLQLPRAIEHAAYFQTREGREAFSSAIGARGFQIRESDPEGGDEPPFGVSFYRKDKPFYYDIDELTLSLLALAEEHGGVYDGWETSVVKI